jgi:ribonuclease VapC
MFVDASAVVAVLANEPEATRLSAKISGARQVLFSPLAYHEACVGLAHAIGCEPAAAEDKVNDLLASAEIITVELTREIGMAAVMAHAVYGKGRHRAALNMGDCFAYACAKAHRVPLFCKGEDFIHTDIALA